MRHLTTLLGMTTEEIEAIFALSAEIKSEYHDGQRPPRWPARMLTQIFDKPSLRTRVSFEAAAIQLGGNATFMSSKDAGLQGRESLADVARVISSYSDAVVLRTFSQQLIEDFAAHSSCPVINGLSDERHPCQALTDLFTIQEAFGGLKGLKIVYVGDGNNVALSLATLGAILGIPMTICAPPGYEIDRKLLKEVHEKYPGAETVEEVDPGKAVDGADVIYTDVWASMGQEAEAEKKNRIFAPYQINEALMATAPPGCRFMHCLPARRGTEVTNGVIDGEDSIVFPQAENRLHLAKGLLVWLLRNQPETARGGLALKEAKSRKSSPRTGAASRRRENASRNGQRKTAKPAAKKKSGR